MERYAVVDCEISTSLNEAWFASSGGTRTVLFIVNYCGHMVGMSILITSIKWDNKFFFTFKGKFIPYDGSEDPRTWDGCFNVQQKKGLISTKESL